MRLLLISKYIIFINRNFILSSFLAFFYKVFFIRAALVPKDWKFLFKSCVVLVLVLCKKYLFKSIVFLQCLFNRFEACKLKKKKVWVKIIELNLCKSSFVCRRFLGWSSAKVKNIEKGYLEWSFEKIKIVLVEISRGNSWIFE